MSELIARAKVTYSEVGLVIDRATSYDEWQELGSVLGRIGKAHQWWIGDWVNFGERAYGEKYAQALELTGLDYSTLQSYSWVASRIEMFRRRNVLSWSHHAEVASLPPADADDLLDDAEQDGWTRNTLRDAVRSVKADGTETRRTVPILDDATELLAVCKKWNPDALERLSQSDCRKLAGRLDEAVALIDDIRAALVPRLDSLPAATKGARA